MAMILARFIRRSHFITEYVGHLYEKVGIQIRAFLTSTLVEDEGLDLESW